MTSHTRFAILYEIDGGAYRWDITPSMYNDRAFECEHGKLRWENLTPDRYADRASFDVHLDSFLKS
jgi:hypothetical protein